jgi:hypothetical protein
MRVVKGPPPIFGTITDAVASFDARRRAVMLARYVYCPRHGDKGRMVFANRLLNEQDQAGGGPAISGRNFRYLLGDCKTRLAGLTGYPLKRA